MIRFYNCKILTDNIIDGELWVNDNKIEYIGTYKSGIFEKEIDCNGNLIMAGFKNCHTHSAMTFLRSQADDMPLNKWLNDLVFPAEKRIDNKKGKWFCYIAIMEYLSSGITSAFDMYFLRDAMAEASKETGFRTVLCGALNDFVSNVKELEEDFYKYNDYCSTVSHRLGFHAEYTTNYDLLCEISDLSNKLKQPIYTHCAETEKEVKECIKRYGKTPVKLFDEIGLFNYGGGIFHGNYLSEEDIDIIKNRNIYVITNPASNLKLASGICEVEKLYKQNINIALGTDGAASNNALDMFREMYLVTALQKYHLSDPSAMSGEIVLQIASNTDLISKDCDKLAVGKLADFILIDLHKPNMQPITNIIKNIVYSGSKDNVLMTVVNGKILYDNGKFNIGIEDNEIYAKCNKYIKEIYNG